MLFFLCKLKRVAGKREKIKVDHLHKWSQIKKSLNLFILNINTIILKLLIFILNDLFIN